MIYTMLAVINLHVIIPSSSSNNIFKGYFNSHYQQKIALTQFDNWRALNGKVILCAQEHTQADLRNYTPVKIIRISVLNQKIRSRLLFSEAYFDRNKKIVITINCRDSSENNLSLLNCPGKTYIWNGKYFNHSKSQRLRSSGFRGELKDKKLKVAFVNKLRKCANPRALISETENEFPKGVLLEVAHFVISLRGGKWEQKNIYNMEDQSQIQLNHMFDKLSFVSSQENSFRKDIQVTVQAYRYLNLNREDYSPIKYGKSHIINFSYSNKRKTMKLLNSFRLPEDLGSNGSDIHGWEFRIKYGNRVIKKMIYEILP